jgi:ferredoxin
MNKLQIEITRRKCQGFGKCAETAPTVFRVGDDRKVVVLDSSGAEEGAVVQAAKSCPYRVIALTDEAGRPVFPPLRKA